jgi:hypothetical protein
VQLVRIARRRRLGHAPPTPLQHTVADTAAADTTTADAATTAAAAGNATTANWIERQRSF